MLRKVFLADLKAGDKIALDGGDELIPAVLATDGNYNWQKAVIPPDQVVQVLSTTILFVVRGDELFRVIHA